MFNHHNPLNKEHYDYFVRCVNRFNTLIIEKEYKLFVLTYINLEISVFSSIQKKIQEFKKFLDSTIINNFGFKPEISLKDGLKNTYQDYIKTYADN